MLEVYQDTLIDLLQPKTSGGKPKKLDIKKDSKVRPLPKHIVDVIRLPRLKWLKYKIP